MADDKNPHLNKKPNSLDRIGSEGSSYSKYRSDLLLMEQRSRIETVEMQRQRNEINQLQNEKERLAREVRFVARGINQPSESLFRSLGASEEVAKTVMGTIPAKNLPAAVSRQHASYQQQVEAQIADLSSRYQQGQQARQTDAARLFQQHVISVVSNPRRGISSLEREPSFQEGVESYAGMGSLEKLTKGLSRVSKARELAGTKLAAASVDVNTPEGRAAFVQLESDYREKIKKEAQLESAIQTRERQQSILKKEVEYGEKSAAGIMHRRGALEIEEGVRRGAYGSMGDISQRLKSSEDAFLSTLTKFREELEKTGTVTAKTREEYEKVNQEYEKQRQIMREATGSGIGGNGGRGGRFLSTLANYGDLAGRAVDAVSYFGVGLQSEQMATRIQSASMMNQKYTDAFAASQGDMAAMRRFSQDQFSRAAQFGNAYKDRAEALGGLSAGVDIVTGTAAAVMAARTGNASWSLSGGLSTGNLISGAQTAARLAAGVTGAQTQLGFAQQDIQLTDVVNAVPDAAKQALFGYRMSMLGQMRGAGSRLPGLYDAATSRATVEQLSTLGIGLQEQAALFGTGVSAIGPAFARSPTAAAQTVLRGGQLQAAGVMSAQSYMQQVGQMTMLGGGAKDVEEILASAVQRGVDDAKSLEGIMDLAQSFARDSASRGIGAVTEMQRGISFGLEKYADLPIDESLKRGLVSSQQQDAAGRIKAAGSRLGYESMTFIDTLTSKIPGLTTFEAGRLSGKDPREMEAVYRQYKDQLQPGKTVSSTLMSALGDYAGLFVDPSGRATGRAGLDIAKNAAVSMSLEGMFVSGLIPPEEKSKVMKAIETGDVSGLSALTQRKVGGLVSGAAGLMGQAYKTPTTPTPLMPLTGEAGAAQLAQAAMASGQAGQALQAQGMLGENAPMSLISQIMTRAAATADVEKAGKDAAQAGEKMTIDTSKFDESVVKFDKAVDKLNEAIRPLGANYNLTPNRDADIARLFMHNLVGPGGIPLSPDAMNRNKQ